jgi:hypothetical protein
MAALTSPFSSFPDPTSVEEDEIGELGEGHQWTTGGVGGDERLNIGKELEDGFLEETRVAGELATGDVPDELVRSEDGELAPDCPDCDPSSSEGAALVPRISPESFGATPVGLRRDRARGNSGGRGMTMDRDII